MINKHMVSENFDSLFKEASRVREQAHVPYSKFKVGAAFLTEDNKINIWLQCRKCSLSSVTVC